MYYSELPTEGFVGQYPSTAPYYADRFIFPNNGPFYGSAKQAMRQCGGKTGRAWKATVMYVEVDVDGNPLRCDHCSGWTRYEGDSKHCPECHDTGFRYYWEKS